METVGSWISGKSLQGGVSHCPTKSGQAVSAPGEFSLLAPGPATLPTPIVRRYGKMEHSNLFMLFEEIFGVCILLLILLMYLFYVKFPLNVDEDK